MSKPTQMIQMSDPEASDMLKELAKDDVRSMGSETAWLIRQEFNRRFSFNTEDSTVTVDKKQLAPKAQ